MICLEIGYLFVCVFSDGKYHVSSFVIHEWDCNLQLPGHCIRQLKQPADINYDQHSIIFNLKLI